MADERKAVARLKAQVDESQARVRELEAARDKLVRDFSELVRELEEERDKWRRIRTPTHGSCCTCQRCGVPHDECRCDLDDVVDELRELRESARDAYGTMCEQVRRCKRWGRSHEELSGSAERLRAALAKGGDRLATPAETEQCIESWGRVKMPPSKRGIGGLRKMGEPWEEAFKELPEVWLERPDPPHHSGEPWPWCANSFERGFTAATERIRAVFDAVEESGKGITDEVVRQHLDEEHKASLAIVPYSEWLKLAAAIRGK